MGRSTNVYAAHDCTFDVTTNTDKKAKKKYYTSLILGHYE